MIVNRMSLSGSALGKGMFAASGMKLDPKLGRRYDIKLATTRSTGSTMRSSASNRSSSSHSKLYRDGWARGIHHQLGPSGGTQPLRIADIFSPDKDWQQAVYDAAMEHQRAGRHLKAGKRASAARMSMTTMRGCSTTMVRCCCSATASGRWWRITHSLFPYDALEIGRRVQGLLATVIEELISEPPQAEVVAQHHALVVAPEEAAPLQVGTMLRRSR